MWGMDQSATSVKALVSQCVDGAVFPAKKVAFQFAVGPPEHAWYDWSMGHRCGDGRRS